MKRLFGRGPTTLLRGLTITMVINHLGYLGWSSKYQNHYSICQPCKSFANFQLPLRKFSLHTIRFPKTLPEEQIGVWLGHRLRGSPCVNTANSINTYKHLIKNQVEINILYLQHLWTAFHVKKAMCSLKVVVPQVSKKAGGLRIHQFHPIPAILCWLQVNLMNTWASELIDELGMTFLQSSNI